MGSASCKEYVTKKSESDGIAGSYFSTSTTNMSIEYTDPVTICNESDIQENEMKEFPFNEETRVLLIRQNGLLTAIGNKCTHYGASLVTGTLGYGRVRCPWHGACFHIQTGDIEDFPGMDSLPCYKVGVTSDGQVQVRAKRKDLENRKRIKNMVKRKTEDGRVFIVVGGGAAGAVCVETLRQEGFTGRIIMICRENVLPYDRVKISKTMNLKFESIQLRKQDFYDQHDIEVLLGVEATKLNTANKTLFCSNGQEYQFHKIFIATGMAAVKIPINGWRHSNIVTVRDYADTEAINAMITPELNVVCLGSSFIALEAAQFLVKKVKSVTLIGRTKYPLETSFGSRIGERVLRLYKENGVNMLMENRIMEIVGHTNGNVESVVLADGTSLPCDLLIMGVGGRCYTDFLKGSGVKVNENGSVDTDMHLQTSVPHIYVGGDIANSPVYSIGNEKAQIGHYQLAQYHGRIAALNMSGRVTNLKAVPFFFTLLFGKGFRYSGYGVSADIFIDGDLEGFKFAAYFLNSEQYVIAVASVGRDPIVAQFAELQSQGKRLHLREIQDDPLAWTQRLLRPDC